MKKLLVALSLGLVATAAVSLHADAGVLQQAANNAAQQAVQQANEAAALASQEIQKALPQAKDAVVDLMAQLSDLSDSEDFLSSLSPEKRTKMETTWQALAKPLSESVSTALKQAKDADAPINVTQLSLDIAKKAPAMLTTLAKDAKPYNGPKLSWNTATAYAKAYASWTKDIALEAANNLALVSPILVKKLTACLMKINQGSAEAVAPEISTDAMNEAIALD